MHTSQLAKAKFTLLLVAYLVFPEFASANPLDDIASMDASKELIDLNKFMVNSNQFKDLSKIFPHRDEDQLVESPDDQKLKYDVETLETSNLKKDIDELEERYRIPAFKFDSDIFADENIEANNDDDDNDDDDDNAPNHLILTITLIFVALLSVSLYAALVIWRANLEQRYAMRELLVNNNDDDCYQPRTHNGGQQLC